MNGRKKFNLRFSIAKQQKDFSANDTDKPCLPLNWKSSSRWWNGKKTVDAVGLSNY